MSKFEFFDRYKSLEVIKGIKAGDKLIKDLCIENETCLGNRQVGSRSYHIFYFKKEKQFCLYYHGGGTDSMYTTLDLDSMLKHVNSLTS